MAHDLCDDLELVAPGGDYYFDDGFPTASGGGPGLQHEQMDCTSASDYKEGKDIQGIPWERLNYSRDQYRKMRLKEYKNYQSLTRSRSGLEQECKKVERKDTFYDFHSSTRAVKSTIVHFQLRNLLWATSKHDVYLVQNYSVMHWSPLLQRGREVLNVASQLTPTENVKGARRLSRVQISTMALKDNLMAVGGFQGELICKYVDKPGVAFCTNLTGNNNSITNAVDIYQAPNGATRVMAANNDCIVRTFDTERYNLLTQFTFPWSVNNASASPDGKLLAVLGDSSECLLADSQSGKEIATLHGHLDYSFASAWHPDGHVLATGNQDATCRLWDVRNLSESFAVLRGRIGAVRGLRFSPDGRFLAAAEAADFVHVYDVAAAGGAGAEQEVDLFGEVAGAAFSPDGEALFVSVADRTYGGVLEFRRRRSYGYLDSFFF
ncbi:putative WD repeat-containing protein C2A9.03 [Dichanthelium oligosanthes]|uniref:Putative WD repeat-containing protein C2A9.03 n=1 Tax=Dichanthelium oligosanthes TaxID=888268 RepID=A0A1E5VWR0_9POAL|nr:putative WD repeat-containing protein C2A9.03 [Dichanthelium oligosanthes]